jgi:hypothetical protein
MSDTIPCVTLPSLSGIPKIPLLGGAELRGFVDPSLGPATDCRVNVTLLLQVAPYLANLACVIKLMNVVAKVKLCERGDRSDQQAARRRAGARGLDQPVARLHSVPGPA